MATDASAGTPEPTGNGRERRWLRPLAYTLLGAVVAAAVFVVVDRSGGSGSDPAAPSTTAATTTTLAPGDRGQGLPDHPAVAGADPVRPRWHRGREHVARQRRHHQRAGPDHDGGARDRQATTSIEVTFADGSHDDRAGGVVDTRPRHRGAAARLAAEGDRARGARRAACRSATTRSRSATPSASPTR